MSLNHSASKLPIIRTMSVKCKSFIFLCWMASLWIPLHLNLAAGSPSSGANYYDAEEPIFHEGYIYAPNPSEEEVVSNSLMAPEPLDLSADSRFSDSEAAWELKVNGNSNLSPSLYKKPSQEYRKPGSREKRRGVTHSNCGTEQFHEPPPNARNLIGPTLKRSDVATTGEELKAKQEKENQDRHRLKKSHPSNAANYWACETSFTWTDLGGDHYPRHVRTAVCNSLRCANGVYHCLPQTYKLKVLKRFALSDSATFEEHNNLLPVELRAAWRLVDHEIVHCCECSSRPLAFRK
ncbi:Protein trunk [Folsomia candida]|uniref:Protein trunk n=1 Tax=Folsomia candida TaxID=158441 RepID=A0A226EXH6_FOLCA|nr:Protein trunk [Folsomia candida]